MDESDRFAASLETLRRQRQLEILASGTELEVGDAAACPLPVEQLAATTGGEPYVISEIDSGLTAYVYRIHAGGQDWTLKRARPDCLVRNVDGRTSFLNEIQRRADFARLKRAPGGERRFAAIVDTRYASLRRGVLLSPWIEGVVASAWDERKLVQLFDVAVECTVAGLFEWDYCPGNILDDGAQIRLFDFGYMYRFDPRVHFNSAGNGRDEPQFHPAERFETRNYFGVLLDLEQEHGADAALTAFRLEKEIALDAYRRLRARLARRGATAEVLQWLAIITRHWREALRGDLETLYLVEGWRSHKLDVDDDLNGQSCTPRTLLRADWLLAALAGQFDALQAHGAFFGEDAGAERWALLARYRQQRARAAMLQVAAASAGGRAGI